MRAEMSGAITLFFIAILLAAIFFAVRGIVRYAKRREDDRQEMLELMREQKHRDK